jgi:hypothetical protein
VDNLLYLIGFRLATILLEINARVQGPGHLEHMMTAPDAGLSKKALGDLEQLAKPDVGAGAIKLLNCVVNGHILAPWVM